MLIRCLSTTRQEGHSASETMSQTHHLCHVALRPMRLLRVPLPGTCSCGGTRRTNGGWRGSCSTGSWRRTRGPCCTCMRFRCSLIFRPDTLPWDVPAPRFSSHALVLQCSRCQVTRMNVVLPRNCVVVDVASRARAALQPLRSPHTTCPRLFCAGITASQLRRLRPGSAAVGLGGAWCAPWSDSARRPAWPRSCLRCRPPIALQGPSMPKAGADIVSRIPCHFTRVCLPMYPSTRRTSRMRPCFIHVQSVFRARCATPAMCATQNYPRCRIKGPGYRVDEHTVRVRTSSVRQEGPYDSSIVSLQV